MMLGAGSLIVVYSFENRCKIPTPETEKQAEVTLSTTRYGLLCTRAT